MAVAEKEERKFPAPGLMPRGMRLLLFLVAMGWAFFVISSFQQTNALVMHTHGGYQNAYKRLIKNFGRVMSEINEFSGPHQVESTMAGREAETTSQQSSIGEIVKWEKKAEDASSSDSKPAESQSGDKAGAHPSISRTPSPTVTRSNPTLRHASKSNTASLSPDPAAAAAQKEQPQKQRKEEDAEKQQVASASASSEERNDNKPAPKVGKGLTNFKLLPPFSETSEIGPHAIITMVAGNSAARHVVALVQSLVDVGTKTPIVVMLQQGGGGSPECIDDKWKHSVGRSTVRCDGDDTVPEEIISGFYVKILKKLGAHLMVTPEIPRTQYTKNIAGGTQMFWGMSLNRLQIFKMTQFKKLLYMDSDTLVLKVRR